MPVTITDNYGTSISLALPDEQDALALAVAGGGTLTITPARPSGVLSRIAVARIGVSVAALGAAVQGRVAVARIGVRVAAQAAAILARQAVARIGVRGQAVGARIEARTAVARIGVQGVALGEAVTPFDLASLFDGGTYPGSLHEAAGLANVFTDAAGTINATGVDDACRYLADTSGNGHPFVQSNIDAAPRVKLNSAGKYIIETDGVDDFMKTVNTVDFSAVSTITLAMGVTTLGEPSTRNNLFGTSDATNPGRLLVQGPYLSGTWWRFTVVADDIAPVFETNDNQYASPDTRVLMIRADLTGAQMWLDNVGDGAEVGSVTYTLTAWGNQKMTLASLLSGIWLAKAQFSTVMAIGRDLTEAQRLDVAARIASSMGHTI